MSSAEEDSLMASKKRKLQRACDYCRQKKSKLVIVKSSFGARSRQPLFSQM